MSERFSYKTIPTDPGVYVMYDRQNRAAYVGISGNLRSRIEQHLTRRDSSVTTGVGTAVLIPDHVHRVCWWLDDEFDVRDKLEAAELIAFEIFDPALRSMGHVTDRAKAALSNGSYAERVRSIFTASPHGTFVPKNLGNLADVVLELEKRLERLERGSEGT